MIAQTKATKKEDFYNKKLLPEQSIEEVGQDVEKWAEQRKLEMETMQKNETFRKEFLQNLSHELKTPIFAIQGYVDTLMSGALHQEEVGMKFLKNTSRNVERLTTLIKDLDEISRLESGELKLQYEHFSIHTLASDVLENLELKIKEKNILAGFKKDADQDFNVYGDKEKIRQVLINLVDNAIKYGKQEGGRIEIAFFRFDNESIIVEITDNGSGISEEHRIRIFERFFRTDTARARKEGGSGLGLAICKHIIEAHGQTIHVRSTLDVGTTFVFSMALVK
jgi:two-component system phosphate regulon sensor histidine kinase PhoR